MQKAILIAEKPSLMREIQSAVRELGKDLNMNIDFLAQAGHLVGLKMPSEINEKYKKWSLDNLPIQVPYEYYVLKGKEKLVKDIRHAVKNGGYDFVIHAGDPDQEGELLIRETLEYVGNKLPVKRFWSNDLTHPAIIKALKSMKDDSEYDGFYNAALTRQHLDYQFGMNLTVAASVKYGGYGNQYKLGRVKCPIIRILVDRERAIRNFVEKTTYKKAFDYEGGEFVCDKEFETPKEAELNPAPKFCTVLEYKSGEKSYQAPKLFKLSTLQQEASKAFKFSGARTLEIAQSLYEKKVTSYPRTSCEYLFSTSELEPVKNAVAKIFNVSPSLLIQSEKDILSNKTYTNDKAASEEGHTALIPTGHTASLTDEEAKVYELICRRFLAMFGGKKKVHTVSAKAVENDNLQGDVYDYSASETIDRGYEAILYPNKKDKEEVILTLKKGDRLEPVSFHVKECTTKPPARYNDGSLIKYLDNPEEYKDEEEGKIKYQIGTPATRANIIEDCKKCGYFKQEKGAYYAEQKAEAIVDEIGDTVLFNVTTSGVWESYLIGIRNRELDASKIEDDLYNQCVLVTEDIKKRERKTAAVSVDTKLSLGKCPKCGSDISSGKFGAYCTGKCGISLGKIYGNSITDAQIKKILKGEKILIKGLTSKKGSKYDAYFEMDKNNPTEQFSYTDKEGKTVSRYQIKYNMSFPERK